MESLHKEEVKTTPFYKFHKALNAKMAPFAGYEMPIQYIGIREEHEIVRSASGIFDVSHMGEFIIEGIRALDFLQYVTSNDVAKLTIGKAQYSCMPNADGGIVDDLLVYQLGLNKYMLVVNAANIIKDFDWLASQNSFGVDIIDVSDKTALLAIQGPQTVHLLEKLVDNSIDLNTIRYYHFITTTFAGIANVIVSATGYTGSGGFELYFEAKDSDAIWNAVTNLGIQPIGLAARDTLRLEKGFSLYGNDIDATTTPISSGLGWITKFNKNFIAKEIIEKEYLGGSKQKLIAFKMLDKNIGRHGYEICDEKGAIIGRVTSGSISPTLNIGIGLGYVASDYLKNNTVIFIKIRTKLVEAVITKLPFV